MKNFTALIAVRKGSERVKNKNIRTFCGSSLLEIKIKQALACELIDEIVVSTDCLDMMSVAKRLGVKVHERPDYFCSSKISMNLVYEYLAESVQGNHIVYLHATSPLLTNKSLTNAINVYKNLENKYDSLASVEHVKKYIWHNGMPVNYDPNSHPRSQDLPDYYALNFAINIISRNNMIKNKNIIGKRFFSYVIDEIESIDIDNQEDFEIAQAIYKLRRM